MHRFSTLLALLIVCRLSGSIGLKCLTCDWSHGFDECDAKGYMKQCMPSQKSCETVARRVGAFTLVRKGCKDRVACRGNQFQNLVGSGRSTQCNEDQESSFCTCCCSDDFCNVGTLACVENKQQGPRTVENDCPAVPRRLPHGKVECRDEHRGGSVCEYSCNEKDYSIWPPGSETNVCLTNGSWVHEPPCCARPCPPYFLADVAVLFHFTGERADELLRSYLEQGVIFGVIADDAVKISAMYYSSEPDESSVIKFNDYGTNSTHLQELLYKRIAVKNEGPINATKALQYASDKLLTPGFGVRDARVRKSIDLVLNENPDEGAIAVGRELRSRGFTMYTFAFETDGAKLDRELLRDVVGDEKHVFVFDGAYTMEALEALDTPFCNDPCDHVMHDHE